MMYLPSPRPKIRITVSSKNGMRKASSLKAKARKIIVKIVKIRKNVPKKSFKKDRERKRKGDFSQK